MGEILLPRQICILPGLALQLRLVQAVFHAALTEHQGCVPLFCSLVQMLTAVLFAIETSSFK